MVENQDIRALLRELASSVRGNKLTNYCIRYSCFFSISLNHLSISY